MFRRAYCSSFPRDAKSKVAQIYALYKKLELDFPVQMCHVKVLR